MDEEKQVANPQGEQTPPAEPTPQAETQQPTTEKGPVAKQEPSEATDRLDKHPRFQELNQKAKLSKREAEEYKRLYEEALAQKPQPTQTVADPYAGMSAEEKEQTRAFIDKFVLPEVQKRYEPFVHEVKTERLNKQVSEAKEFANQFGINFDQKLPEIVDYLSRPENKGRLTAKEAVANLYMDDILGTVKNKTAEELSRQKEELNEKKKLANTLSSTAAPSSVIQTDEMARRKMTPQERQEADIRWAIEQAKAGVRNPKVKGE